MAVSLEVINLINLRFYGLSFLVRRFQLVQRHGKASFLSEQIKCRDFESATCNYLWELERLSKRDAKTPAAATVTVLWVRIVRYAVVVFRSVLSDIYHHTAFSQLLQNSRDGQNMCSQQIMCERVT
jgi:hypothetical protein